MVKVARLLTLLPRHHRRARPLRRRPIPAAVKVSTINERRRLDAVLRHRAEALGGATSDPVDDRNVEERGIHRHRHRLLRQAQPPKVAATVSRLAAIHVIMRILGESPMRSTPLRRFQNPS